MFAPRALWLAGLLVAWLIALPARADSPPLVVVPFSTPCFDAAALVAAVHGRVPDAAISVGSERLGRQRVRVSERAGELVVELEARDQAGRLEGSERRLVPEKECAAQLALVSLIVARAAVPLESMAVAPPSRERLHKPDRVDHAPHLAAELSPLPAASSSPEPERQPDVVPRPSPSPSPAGPAMQRESSSHPLSVIASRGPRWPGPLPALARRRLEVGAQAGWRFALDGGSASVPEGQVYLGWRSRFVALVLHAGVSGEFSAVGHFSSATTTSAITVAARRIPLALEVEGALPLWPLAGRLTLSVGPELLVWLARSTGLTSAASDAFVEPGLVARAAYVYEHGALQVGCGAQLDVAFITDHLAVGGVGTLVTTPRVSLGPFVSLGATFF